MGAYGRYRSSGCNRVFSGCQCGYGNGNASEKGMMYQLHLKKIAFHGTALRSILRIGFPAGLESVMYNIANLIIQIFVNKLGTDTVAAWGTFAKIDAVFWMVINAFGIAITTFVGQNYGAGRKDRMRKSVRVCMVMS